MATLTSLSNEVIEVILSCSDISFEDIINLRCVCKQFRWVGTGKEYCFHEKKFCQRWPSAKKYYDWQSEKPEHKKFEENEEKEKPLSFIETGINYIKQLRNYIRKEMSILKCSSTEMVIRKEYLEEEFSVKELSEEELSNVINSTTTNKYDLQLEYLFFVDEIEHLLAQLPRAGCDLTEKSCYIKLYDFLRIFWRNNILTRYIEEQPYKELLEESATIWAQQLQFGKNVSYSSVKASLKGIAQEALNFLREKHPEHSIFSTPNEYFIEWENNNIDNNYWSEEEGIQIMGTLEEYMWGKLKFRPICSRKLEYMCIDYVLEHKRGQDLILFIIYKTVARRFGLRCDIVFHSDSDGIQLFWVPRYTFTTDTRGDINPLIGAQYRDNVRCFRLTIGEYPYCIFYIGGSMYIKTLTELLKWILHKESCNNKLRHLSFVIDDDISKSLSNILRLEVPKTRPQEAKFAVGMIVTHSVEFTDCSTGVIIGWYKNNFNKTNFYFPIKIISYYVMPMKQCCNYSIADQRIYYIILTKSDKLCHVKGDDITLTKPSQIENKNIYRFFCKFEGTHYVPNERLAAVYPYDAAIAAETIFKS